MSKFPWKSGDWLAVCDQCGMKAFASQLTKRWDGYMVHKEERFGCWETRHPQEFVRAVPDNHPLPWTRPEPADLDIGPTFNCAGAYPVLIPSVLVASQTFGKGYSKGPVRIEDGATITIMCEWVIE